MKFKLLVMLLVLMIVLVMYPAGATGSPTTASQFVGASGGFQSGHGSSDPGSLIHQASAHYQADPESAVNLYLVPQMGDFEGLPPHPQIPTPFPAFNEHYQVPDVFAVFDLAFPSPVIVSGSSDQIVPF